jgi:meiotically up-regulated gene 157 (Mug157) protein
MLLSPFAVVCTLWFEDSTARQGACIVIAPAQHLVGGVVAQRASLRAVDPYARAVADAVVAVGKIVAHIGGGIRQ